MFSVVNFVDILKISQYYQQTTTQQKYDNSFKIPVILQHKYTYYLPIYNLKHKTGLTFISYKYKLPSI